MVFDDIVNLILEDYKRSVDGVEFTNDPDAIGINPDQYEPYMKNRVRVDMSPEMFLELVADGRSNPDTEKSLRGADKPLNIGRPLLKVRYDDEMGWHVFGHEGRSRMSYAVSLGIEMVTVDVIISGIYGDDMKSKLDELYKLEIIPEDIWNSYKSKSYDKQIGHESSRPTPNKAPSDFNIDDYTGFQI